MESNQNQANIDAAVDWDVVIVGGSLAGSSTAILLKKLQPQWRIAIVEKSECFQRRVGESTVEVSTYFLSKVLGLTAHLQEKHILKQGLRFWHQTGDSDLNFDDCSEIGGKFLVRIPAFQVDRSVLDEEVLDRARKLGVHVLRPWKAVHVSLPDQTQAQAFGEVEAQRMISESEGDPSATEEKRGLKTRWIVDAGGAGAWISNRTGCRKPNLAHPIGSVWARFKGVKSFEDPELAERFPEWAKATYSCRSFATNHLVGQGWWAWMIPLQGGDCSIGVVYDNRYLSAEDIGRAIPGPGPHPWGERLLSFLKENHAVGKEMLSQAKWIEGDHHFRNRLSFYSEKLAGPGYLSVGDASGFIDPFYSPGLDWLSFTVSSSVQLIQECSETASQEEKSKLIDKHNQKFRTSYRRWFEAVYRNKYDYLNEFDLISIAFRLDLGFYYLGVVSQPYLRGKKSFLEPMFITPPSIPIYWFMRFYNWRLSSIARSRQARGVAGQGNRKRRLLIPGFTFHPQSCWPMLKACVRLAFIEVTEGWRSWFPQRRKEQKHEIPKWSQEDMVKSTSEV